MPVDPALPIGISVRNGLYPVVLVAIEAHRVVVEQPLKASSLNVHVQGRVDIARSIEAVMLRSLESLSAWPGEQSLARSGATSRPTLRTERYGAAVFTTNARV